MNITSEHLRAILPWAEQSANAPHEINGAKRRYNQNEWDCGTSCCMHGAAVLLATGQPATYGPTDDDYRDLSDETRDGVMSLLRSPGGTPELIRRVLDGDITIDRGVRIEPGAWIGPDAWIGRGVRIGRGAWIGPDVRIGPDAWIEPGAWIDRGVRIKPGAVVERTNS